MAKPASPERVVAAERLEALAAAGSRAGANGLYTESMVETMSPRRIAEVINTYVERVNVDYVKESKRKARIAALQFVVLGMVLGGGIVYAAIMLFFHPLRDILAQLTHK